MKAKKRVYNHVDCAEGSLTVAKYKYILFYFFVRPTQMVITLSLSLFNLRNTVGLFS